MELVQSQFLFLSEDSPTEHASSAETLPHNLALRAVAGQFFQANESLPSSGAYTRNSQSLGTVTEIVESMKRVPGHRKNAVLLTRSPLPDSLKPYWGSHPISRQNVELIKIQVELQRAAECIIDANLRL